MAAEFGLLTAGTYDYDRIEHSISSGQRPCSEFHALLRNASFAPVMLDCSNPPRLAEWASLFWNPFKAQRLARAVRQHGALLAMSETTGVPAALGLATYGVRVPFFCIAHGTYFDNPKFRLGVPMLRRMPHFHLLCLSRAIADKLISQFGFAPERCHVLGVATDTDFFTPKPLDGGGVIASAGVVERDYATLFKAVEGLDVQVELATNSAWTESFNMNGMTIPANVTAGPLPMFTGIRDLYARSRFVVLPLNPVDFSCGYSVILEAMAMGKAVISSRNAGHSDLIVPGVTGLYLECGDVAGLRDSILRLLSDPEEAERMGRAGRERVLETGSMFRYREFVPEMMRSVLAAQRSRSGLSSVT